MNLNYFHKNKTVQYTTPPYISFHIKDSRVELCTELFCAIIPTLFL